jgi:hypothetical protein
MDHRVGSIVPESGIYDVLHDNVHAQKHQVTCIAGKRFPPCHTCDKHVQYRLFRSATHIEDHHLLKR